MFQEIKIFDPKNFIKLDFQTMRKVYRQTLYKAKIKGSQRKIIGFLAKQELTGKYFMCQHEIGKPEPKNKLYNIEVCDGYEKVEI